MTDIAIFVIRDTFSDGSEAFGVRLAIPRVGSLDIDCLGERNADALAAALSDTFALHGLEPQLQMTEIHKVAGWEA